MARFQPLKGFKATEDRLLDGHQVVYTFGVQRLDNIRSTFHPLDYSTRCNIIPSSWRVQLRYERIPELNDTYNFTIKVRRRDTSNHRLKAKAIVTFYDAFENSILFPFMVDKDRMICGDEVERVVDNITPSELSRVVLVRVSILIEQCHTGNHWLAGFEAKSGNSIKLSKL